VEADATQQRGGRLIAPRSDRMACSSSARSEEGAELELGMRVLTSYLIRSLCTAPSRIHRRGREPRVKEVFLNEEERREG